VRPPHWNIAIVAAPKFRWTTGPGRLSIRAGISDRQHPGVEQQMIAPTRQACAHLDTIRDVTPSALGCEDCLKTGDKWVHLRICRDCGHVGCCDQSPNRHARKHFQATGHPIIEGYDPPEGWGWCYVDHVEVDLAGRTTPQRGPIPKFV
jgi:hypothetical protein